MTTISRASGGAANDEPTATGRLALAFRARTLPKEAFTHEAHLRVGLWHVLAYGEAAALDELRRAIRAFNEAHGGVNSDSAGYHETITRFHVWRIARFAETAATARPIDELADALVGECGARDLPLRHWTRERLMSREARLAWLEPDLAPLAVPSP
jgi:hypothetical protein